VFKGTSVAWIGSRSPQSGAAAVYLDGKLRATVDLYASKAAYRAAVWTASGLSKDATHTIVVKTLGTPDERSSGRDVVIDALDVAGTLLQAPPLPAWSRVEETGAGVAFSGSWRRVRSTHLSGASYRCSASATASVTFTFTGTRVRWIGTRGRAFGRALLSIDGHKAVVVDLYSASTAYRHILWDSGGLASGSHVLRIAPARKKTAAATGYTVGVDRFDALVQ
jgi:hypothetical protein